MGKVRFRAQVVGSESAIAGIDLMRDSVRAEVSAATKASLKSVQKRAKGILGQSREEKAEGEKHLQTTIRTQQKTGAVSGLVKAGAAGARHAWLVEHGTRPHEIKVPGKYAKGTPKRVLSDGLRMYGRKAKHPGAKARPYMAPALDAEQGAYRAAVAMATKKGLQP